MLEKNYLWRIYWRLAGVIMVCVVVALAVVSYFSHRVFDAELVPETEQKAATVGASVRALVLKATSYGIDFSQLYGVEQTFAEVFEENPEFAYMGHSAIPSGGSQTVTLPSGAQGSPISVGD